MTQFTPTTSTETRNADLAALILRVSTGGLFVAHALMKIMVFTPAGTASYFESLGLPGFLAYLTIAAELVGGALLILGVATRWIALALAAELLGAAILGHGGNGFFFNNEGGGWEYPVFWAVTLVALSLLGNGAYALGKRD
ncbi:DoxX family protein [Paracoccus sulfuroxidans]|uniref:Putative oxidoreductase n=1 Tax=Paracoccus sulfuroxidans TaxID=384678 RepID=A0A562NHJ5_9RHOB|nr:DoxX family protein [Paracoccus sulfuroxidans]TWI31574.1 putative oxidoreductase [Paracoccus sulfuroxidans]